METSAHWLFLVLFCSDAVVSSCLRTLPTETAHPASISTSNASVQDNVSHLLLHKGVSSAAASGGAQSDINSSHRSGWPYSCQTTPAVGKVCALYYSSASDSKMTSVETQDSYKPAARFPDVWKGSAMLPVPSCALQLRSMTGYPTENRKANLRLAELAICEKLQFRNLGAKHPPVPDCGAKDGEVCELELSVPAPASDEHQEPYAAAAIALAAYSKVCALFAGPGAEWQCEVHRGDNAVCAGLVLSGGGVTLKGLPIPGLLDLKLEDAYQLGLTELTIASSGRNVYEQTNFYNERHDTLKWQHTPPDVQFCNDLQCLISKYIG